MSAYNVEYGIPCSYAVLAESSEDRFSHVGHVKGTSQMGHAVKKIFQVDDKLSRTATCSAVKTRQSLDNFDVSCITIIFFR